MVAIYRIANKPYDLIGIATIGLAGPGGVRSSLRTLLLNRGTPFDLAAAQPSSALEAGFAPA
jgi:hypothetical protein